MSHSTIVWFRKDLRLHDNPALNAAINQNFPIIPLYIIDSNNKDLILGKNSLWWLENSLFKLDESLKAKGSHLILKIGDPLVIIPKLIKTFNVKAIYWNNYLVPAQLTQDKALTKILLKKNIEVFNFYNHTLLNPLELKNLSGKPYQMFSAFAKAAKDHIKIKSLTASPKKIPAPPLGISSQSVQELKTKGIESKKELNQFWQAGEKAALNKLNLLLEDKLSLYKDERDFPAKDSTSFLSPHLHWGELSVRLLWQKLQLHSHSDTFAKEILWREFAYYLLHYYPNLTHIPIRAPFQRFPWKPSKNNLSAWQNGQTGYPLIDAGMRQLKTIGWLHNRVRMVVASFLVKHLLIPWQEGAKWFWEYLVDADLANNSMNWQWVTGCGVDAAPFFRIFNPIIQAKKFDPQGEYIKHWIPELKDLPIKYIHFPMNAPKELLEKINLKMGIDYPYPIVDHVLARQKALMAFKNLNNN
ncbi:MAG: phrB [Francisellaceae bacterium]|nr:phrB [Francisellaceae bacterium]